MNMTPDESDPKIDPVRLHRIGQVLLVFALTAAVIGFIIGLRQGVTTGRETRAVPEATAAPGDVPVALSYSELAERDLGPNADWQNILPAPGVSVEQLFEEVKYDPQVRRVVLQQREQRRAFDGAPPVVPHEIDQLNATTCLACHEQGLKVGEVVAPRMSHELYANCFQCHVQATDMVVDESYAARTDNTFAGSQSPAEGGRAWPGAPPTLPHATWMRENCLSCHGPTGQQGLRSSHAWRTNCMQCHAPAADLDQSTNFFFDVSSR